MNAWKRLVSRTCTRTCSFTYHMLVILFAFMYTIYHSKTTCIAFLLRNQMTSSHGLQLVAKKVANQPYRLFPIRSSSTTRLCSSTKGTQNVVTSSSVSPSPKSKKIAIVGGGLAGLSTAYHLLSYSISRNMEIPSITVIDKTTVGKGGASSVAGGYVVYMYVLSLLHLL